MGKFNTRQGLSSLANSDVTGQFGVYGGGASIPLLVDGATNRLLTLSDTNSGSVFYVQDADGTRLFDITTTGISVGGNYTLPLTDGTASQYLSTDGSGAVTWEDLPEAGLTYIDVHNNTGATLSKGTPVYVSGTHASGKPTVAGTDANSTGKTPAIGLVSSDISNGADGTVLAAGTLSDIDTSAYTAGDALYVSETQGALTATRPTAVNSKVQKVALVTRSHATNGTVIVMGAGRTNDIPNNVAVEDLWNVDAHPTSADNIDGTSLIWHDYMSRWEAWAPISGFMAYDATGTTVTQAKAVKRQGSLWSGGRASLSVSLADSADTCIGIAYADPGSDNRLMVATTGLIGGLDTSAWSVNDVLYVSGTTAGELVNTPPTTGTVQPVGSVVASSATTGIILVSVNPAGNGTGYLTGIDGEDVGTLNNVDVTGAVTGNVLQFDGTNWVDAELDLQAVTDEGGVTDNSITALSFTAQNTSDTSAVVTGLTLYRDSSSPANGDDLMKISFSGNNSASSQLTYGEIYASIDEVTNPNEVGRLTFRTYNGASFWETGLEIHEGTVSIGNSSPYTMPDADGSANQVLTTDGSGTVSWADGGGSQTLDEVLTEGHISTQDAQFGGVTVSQSDAGSSYIATNSLDDGSEWAALAITSTSASPATNDQLGSIMWFGQNDAAQNTKYATIDIQTADVTDGSEDGTMNFDVMSAGTLTEVLELRGTGITARKNVTVVGGLETQIATGTTTIIEAISGDTTGADWPAMAISRYTTTPADNDNVGTFQFNHMNSVTTLKTFADIEVVATDVTSGTEDGKMIFNILEGGTSTQKLQLLPAGAVIDGTASADIFSLSTSDDTGQYLATRTVNVPTDWNAFEAFRYDVTYATGPIGSQAFSALNDNDETIRYARTTGVIADSTDGSEDGQWRWYAMVAGTDTELMQLDGDGLEIGGASGYTLPLTDGSADQVLTTDGSGNVTWEDAGGTVSDIADIGNVTVTSPVTNQVLIWNGVASEWQNNSVPVPTLAEVTASGASTSTTITVASILQTGSTINVAASGNHYSQLRATTLEVGTSSTEQYEFPASDGNAGEVLMTDGSGALSFEKARSMTFSNSGVHQLTTSTDTFYRLCAATTAPNSTYWTRTTSSTAPSSLTRTAQYSKAGHVIPVDITNAVVNCTVSSSISASASSDTAASEYVGDTITYYMYKWADGSVATQIATWTDTFNGAVSYAEEQSSPTEFTLTANAGDAIFVVARCLTSATATRYWSMQYTIDIQY